MIRALPLLLALACAPLPITTIPVYPFGTGRFTLSTSTIAPRLPDDARTRAIARASAFCALRGERSLPTDITLLTTARRVHYVTIVFECFDPYKVQWDHGNGKVSSG